MRRSFTSFCFAAGLVLLGINWGCSSADSQGIEGKKSLGLTKYDQKINAMLEEMTLEEKVKMIHANSSFTSGGVDRLNIPGAYDFGWPAWCKTGTWQRLDTR